MVSSYHNWHGVILIFFYTINDTVVTPPHMVDSLEIEQLEFEPRLLKASS